MVSLVETTDDGLLKEWDLIRKYLSWNINCPVKLTTEQVQHIDTLIEKRDVQTTDWRGIYGELNTRFIIDNLKAISDEMVKRGLFKYQGV